jgi:hypothetical protein
MQNCMGDMLRRCIDGAPPERQAGDMHRHEFLSLLLSAGGSTALGLAACAAPLASSVAAPPP